MEIETLQKSLSAACAVAVDWFLDNSEEVTTDDWEQDGPDDDELGSVFAFFDDDNDCLYIGRTEGALSDHIEAFNLENAKWWDDWDTLEFLNAQDETDQKALELLLIMGLEPEHCQQMEAKDPEEMFSQFED